ncbi:hypothetical protein MNB_SM-4-1154 [hydrothermal vent metagenome]|uniref:Uncharacterized protein n=1 Tax=hydrothermal vent metagenome TaxID=652676 RepID=A0A1W1CF81_9ZZZZ
MIKEQALDILKEDIAKGYPFSDDFYWRYKDNFVDNDVLVNKIDRHMTEHLTFNQFINFSQFLSLFSFYRMIYSFTIKEDFEGAKIELSRANQYAYMTYHIGSQACKNLNTEDFANHFTGDMQHAAPLLASTVLANDWKNAQLVAEDLINSLNATSCIIGRGNSKATVSWFMLKLLSEIFEQPIDKRKPRHPSDFDLYEMVLENYNTTDVKEVEKLVYLLADKHLENLNLSLEDEEEIHSPFLQIIPFEIIVFLKVRTKIGLKNPTSFLHPLMSQAFVNEILTDNNILEKSIELPYAKELLSELKEEYPDYDKKRQEPTLTTKKEKVTLLKALAPKTGRYRASLPNKHPQAKQLEGDPHSYARFLKDDTFIYEGLEEYDLSEITWSYIGD